MYSENHTWRDNQFRFLQLRLSQSSLIYEKGV